MAKNNSPNTRKDTSSKARKAKKIKTTKRKSSVPKPRNNGTMTEAQFFARIRSALRQAFRYWKPATQALEAVSRPYKGPNKRQKKEYQCNHCKGWFLRRNVEIDHVIECGKLSCYEDVIVFIQRLTRE